MAGIESAANIIVTAGTTTGPTDCVNFINSADLNLDGKNVDTTVFGCTGSGATWGATMQTVKSAKVTLKGFLDKTDTGQAHIWTQWVTPTTGLYIKITFDSAGTNYFNGPMSIDTIAIGDKASGGMVEVTYTLSSNGTCFLSATS